MSKLSGVIAAVPSPFDTTSKVNVNAFVEHAAWCLANGCDLLNVLGTTGEANSLSPDNRKSMMTAAVAELDPARMMVGTGTPDLDTTVELTRHAHALGYVAALVLPPYYYKPVSDLGLFAWYAELSRRTVSSPIPIYLYNFPQLTGIEFSPALCARFSVELGDRIRGAKDSSGNLAYARELAKIDGFDVFPSNEASLADAGRDNFAGCVSATVNIDPATSQRLWKNQSDTGLLESVRGLREAITAHPLIPAVKYLVGKRTGNRLWGKVLPPNLEIAENTKLDALDAIIVHKLAA